MSAAPRDLKRVCRRVVERARALGATQAEAYAERTHRAAVRVRSGEIEDLSQATGKGLGLRVVRGGRLGFAYTSDLSPHGLDDFVRQALALARVTARDPHNKLPTARALEPRNKGLRGLFDPAIEALPGDWMIESALEMERAGKAEDSRVVNFEAVGAGTYLSEVAIASSEGLADGYRGSYVYLYSMPVARGNDGQLQSAYWVDYQRKLGSLQTPEEIGRIAARRAARMVGARAVKTQRVPVVFEPPIAASLIGGIAGAVNGDLVFKGASFLGDKLGKRIAPPTLTVVDDGLRPGGVATAPFDGEGLASRRTPVIDAGVLSAFLYDSYTARKAGARSTANASRGYSSLPSIGTSNFYLERGEQDPRDIVAGVKNGFYVTSMLGSGLSPVTGDYSRGASGLWIRGGELAEPVQEVTVAGNLLEMLGAIDAVGSDLDFRGPVGAPTIRFAELTVAGK